MGTRLTWEEYQRIKDIKILDLEICDYRHVNILNLGWEAWGKWYCNKHEKEHVLCSELCLPVSRNIIGCELVRKRSKRIEEPVKPNRPYDWANSCVIKLIFNYLSPSPSSLTLPSKS